MDHPAIEFASSTDSLTELASPGVLGFTVIALLGGVLFLLMRSMKRHLDSVRSGDFDERTAAKEKEDERADSEEEDGSEDGRGDGDKS